jgi:hypothetical protein
MTQPKQIFDPELSDILRAHKQNIFKDINAIKIGKIEAFDLDNQTASISIVYKKVIDEDSKGVKTLQEYPLLMECPVIGIYGGLGSLEMPVKAGDYAIVFFNDQDIDNWYNGNLGTGPNTERQHDLSDAFAWVGIRNLITALEDYADDRIRLRYGNSKIEILTALIEATTTLFKVTGGFQGTAEVRGETLKADNGATGSMSAASPTGQITVANGIVTSITP